MTKLDPVTFREEKELGKFQETDNVEYLRASRDKALKRLNAAMESNTRLNALVVEHNQVLNPAAAKLNAIRTAWEKYSTNQCDETLGNLEEALDNAFPTRD